MVRRIETILCSAFQKDKNEKPELIAAVARQLKDAYRRKPKKERPKNMVVGLCNSALYSSDTNNLNPIFGSQHKLLPFGNESAQSKAAMH